MHLEIHVTVNLQCIGFIAPVNLQCIGMLRLLLSPNCRLRSTAASSTTSAKRRRSITQS